MSRPTRANRQISSDSDRFDRIFDTLQPEDEDLLMQQALLEAVDAVQTPTTPSIGARSRRSSVRPPAYDPAQPNAQEDATLYDPATWGAVSEVSSGSHRSSTPGLRPIGVEYRPTAPAYSPSSRPQRQTQQYDPSTPLYGRSTRLYDPTGYARRSPSVVPGGEPSPGYSYYGGYGGAQVSPTTANVTARLDILSDRLDRLEAQLTAISHFLTDQMNGSTPIIAPPISTSSSSGNKRKRSSNKKVTFNTSEDEEEEEEEEEEDSSPSTPIKKPKTSPSPKTPSKKSLASSHTPPKAPRKAVPKRPAPNPPAQQPEPVVPAAPAATRKSSRPAKSAQTHVPATTAIRRSVRVAAKYRQKKEN